MRCSYCSKIVDRYVALSYFSGDVANANYFCSLSHLDKWLWRMGQRYRGNYEQSTSDGRNGQLGESPDLQPTKNDGSDGDLLQPRSTQAE